jgi:hypothetical protein
MKAIKIILKYLIGTFVLIQLIQVNIDIPKDTDKSLEIKAPVQIMNILKNSCYDCHSNNIILPWYSKIAPFSWSIARHIDLGRKWVNFSIWNSYNQKQKDKKLEEIYKAVYYAMPLQSYLKMHPKAHLNKSQRKILRQWTKKAPF